MKSHLADARSDLWSLGVILYELLGHRRPFTGSKTELSDAIINLAPPPLTKLQANHCVDLKAIVSQCLAKNPDDRFPSCQHLADDLRRWLEFRPVVSRQASLLERLGLWRRRNPSTALMTITTLGLAAASVVLAMSMLWMRSREAENEAMHSQQLAAQRLEESIRERQRGAETHIDAATMAMHRGNWTAALNYLGLAESMGFAQPIDVALRRVFIYTAKNDSEKQRIELGKLEQAEIPSDKAGLVMLARAERALMDGQDETGTRLVQEAIEAGLPACESAYARSLIAERTPEAIDHLYEALTHDPYHHSAAMLLSSELFLAGRRDEARTSLVAAQAIFPDDPNVVFWFGMLDTAEGNIVQAKERVSTCTTIDPTTRDRIFTRYDLLEVLRKRLFSTDQSNLPSLFANLGKLLAEIKLIDKNFVIRLPPRQKEIISALTSSSLSPISKFLQLFSGQNQPDDAFARAAKINPEGTILLFQAVVLSNASDWKEAEQVAAKAAGSPAMFPEVNELAYVFAAGLAVNQEFNEDARDRVVEFVDRRLELGPLSAEHTHYLAKALWAVNEFESASHMAAEAIEAESENLDFLTTAARIDLENGAPIHGLEYLERILAIDPQHPFATRFKPRFEQRIDEAASGLPDATSDGESPE